MQETGQCAKRGWMLQGTNFLVVFIGILVANYVKIPINIIVIVIMQSSGKDGWVPGADQQASTAPQ